MRSRAYRRYVSDKVAFKRWKHFHRRDEFKRDIFPYVSGYLGMWWAIPIGRYKKWNGSCTHGCCSRCDDDKDQNHERVKFAQMRSEFIR